MAPKSYIYRTRPDDNMFGEREWTQRYNGIDYSMGRPVHKNMSVAPPWAKKIRIDSGRWKYSSLTGYPANVPDYLAVWLMIITDNTMHLIINTMAIMIFGV